LKKKTTPRYGRLPFSQPKNEFSGTKPENHSPPLQWAGVGKQHGKEGTKFTGSSRGKGKGKAPAKEQKTVKNHTGPRRFIRKRYRGVGGQKGALISVKKQGGLEKQRENNVDFTKK